MSPTPPASWRSSGASRWKSLRRPPPPISAPCSPRRSNEIAHPRLRHIFGCAADWRGLGGAGEGGGGGAGGGWGGWVGEGGEGGCGGGGGGGGGGGRGVGGSGVRASRGEAGVAGCGCGSSSSTKEVASWSRPGPVCAN